MTPAEVFDKSVDISDDFVGVWLDGEIRAGWTRYGWQAYVMVTSHNRRTGDVIVKSVRMLRTTDGKPVRTVFCWEGIGHLVERIEKLYKQNRLQGQWTPKEWPAK